MGLYEFIQKYWREPHNDKSSRKKICLQEMQFGIHRNPQWKRGAKMLWATDGTEEIGRVHQ
jgi:hypothetical protein